MSCSIQSHLSLNSPTTLQIRSLGGLSLILISHPHFYTTWADWSRTFHCPVYLAKTDADIWANRTSNVPRANLRLLTQTHTEIAPGATAIICGGHFDGSMVLHWEGRLFVADTLFTVAVRPVFPFHPRPQLSLLRLILFPSRPLKIPTQLVQA